MSELVIRPVASRRDRKAFLEFPWVLYRGDPHWVPPLRIDQKELVNFRPHPFYERNEIQTFLAWRGGDVCGRIAAVVDYGYIEAHNDRRGYFGFFECRDDAEAARGLLDAARGWLAERDIHAIRGPMNPSMNYTTGLLVDGFDSPPTFLMTYNPPYYAKLVEGCGFHKAQDLFAYYGDIEMFPGILEKLGPLFQQIVDRFQVTLRPLDKHHFLKDVEIFLSVYNRALKHTWGFVPLSEAELSHMARGLQWLIVPELCMAAEVDGRVVGVTFGIPDYNPRIRKIDGRLFPFGFLTLLRNRREMKRIRLVSTDVIPEYQRTGIGLALMGGLVPHGLAWGLEEAEFSWVLESNALSRGSLEKGGAQCRKTWRIYDRDG